MHWLDGLAIALLLGAAGAFFGGSVALARSEDLHALYWLIVGIVAIRGSVQIARTGVRG